MNFQKALGKADEGSPDSMRIDIPKDDVDPKSRRIDGVKYVDTEQWQAMKAQCWLACGDRHADR